MKTDVVNLSSDEFLHLQQDVSILLHFAFGKVDVLNVGIDRRFAHIVGQYLRVLQKSQHL
jgi:hypothetical protein